MVEQSVPSGEPGAQKRRSTRITQTVPMTVIGTDALGQPFKERTSTLTINCHGCKYQSKHYVLKNTWVTFEIAHPEPGHDPRRVRAKVIWVQRPRTVQELFQVGAQLEVGGNVWGMAFPPDDWFAFPEAAGAEIPAPVAAPEAAAPLGVPALPAAPAPSDKLRMLPAPSVAEDSAALARQMQRLLADAKGQIQKAVKEAATAAVTAETGNLLREVESQLRAAAKKSLDAVAEQSLDEAVKKAVEKAVDRIEQTRRTVVTAMREQWMRDVDLHIREASLQLTARLGESSETLSAGFSKQMEERIGQASAQLAEVEERMAALRAEATAGAAGAQARLAALQSEMDSATTAAGQEWRERLEKQSEESLAQLRNLEETSRRLKEELAGTAETELPRLRHEWREKLESDMATAGNEWNALVSSAMAGSAQRLASEFSQLSRSAATQTEQEIVARVSGLQQSLAEATEEARGQLASLQAGLQSNLAQADSQIAELRGTAQRVEQLSSRVDAMMQSATDTLDKRFLELLASHLAQLNQQSEAHFRELSQRSEGHIAAMNQRSEGLVAAMVERLQPALDQAGQESLGRMVAELEQQLAPRLESARRTLAELTSGERRAEEALLAQRERLHRASEDYVHDSETRMKEALAQVQKEFENTGRVAMAKLGEELEAKSTDTTHSTFEALYKAAEWYQKKAQTSMQSALEKALDQSVTSLRERAAEISRMFALELDHYSRSFTEHTQGLLDEAARDVVARTRTVVEQASETEGAKFGDEMHRIATEKLQNFADSTSVQRDEITTQIDVHADQVRSRWNEHAGRSFTEFQDHIAKRMAESVGQAHQEFQTALLPIMESWRQSHTEQQREWTETIGRLGNEAIEQYRQRLDNASNSWMVAAVTTLNQHSQNLLDALAKTAEQRLRDTCGQVLNGLAETLRRQLLGVSADLSQNPIPPEQK